MRIDHKSMLNYFTSCLRKLSKNKAKFFLEKNYILSFLTINLA